MKISRFVSFILVSAIIATLVSSAMVFAGPNPPTIFRSLIVNEPDEAVPVEIQDNVDVTLDEPIDVNSDQPLEVTNPSGETLDVTLDEPIDVNSDQPLEVTNPSGETLEVLVPDGVEVTNEDPIEVEVTNALDVDVSGWLHTTEQGFDDWHDIAPTDPSTPSGEMWINTEGYREITVVFDVAGDDVAFDIIWEVDGIEWYYEIWLFDDEHPATPIRNFSKTYNVQGERLHIQLFNFGSTEASLVALAYYMTT